MTDDTFKAELRDIIFEMLEEGLPAAKFYPDSGDGPGDLESMLVSVFSLNQLCNLADLGDWPEAQEELEHEILIGKRARP